MRLNEKEKHIKIMDKIKNAKNINELPKIGYSNIASYIIKKLGLKQELSTKDFEFFIDEVKKHHSFNSIKVKDEFVDVLFSYNNGLGIDNIEDLYYNLIEDDNLDNLLDEVVAKNFKIFELKEIEEKKLHEETLLHINESFEISELPHINMGDLNQRILKDVNENSFYNNFKINDIRNLITAIYSHSLDEILLQIQKLCKSAILDGKILLINNEEYRLFTEEITASILSDNKINYLVEEICAKEKRKLFIYKYNHDEVMDLINDATRISELPPNLSESTLTSYILGNSTIYSCDNRFKSEDFKSLAKLLIDGEKLDSSKIKMVIKKITKIRYPEYSDAMELLIKKLSSLPKLYYLAEEIALYKEKEELFISTQGNNVNVYFIQNDKSPIDGGNFYNCYINREGNLNLSAIIPLDLDRIVPKGMDIDAIEWWIQKNYDPTFKAAGGIILKRDETIGNVTIFKPNDGKVGISVEEKEKMDEISDLDKKIDEKISVLSKLEDEIKSREEYVSSGINELFDEYKNKVIELQSELFKNLDTMKSSIENEVIKKKLKQ